MLKNEHYHKYVCTYIYSYCSLNSILEGLKSISSILKSNLM